MTILIVEGDLAIRHPLSEYLRDCGYRVFESVDTDEAFTLLSDHLTDIRVILCDVMSVGKMNGFALASWVREHMPAVQVVLTATPGQATHKAADLCNETPFIKPYDHQLMLDNIKQLMAKRDAVVAANEAPKD